MHMWDVAHGVHQISGSRQLITILLLTATTKVSSCHHFQKQNDQNPGSNQTPVVK